MVLVDFSFFRLKYFEKSKIDGMIVKILCDQSAIDIG